jgi:hypothetical protein
MARPLRSRCVSYVSVSASSVQRPHELSYRAGRPAVVEIQRAPSQDVVARTWLEQPAFIAAQPLVSRAPRYWRCVDCGPVTSSSDNVAGRHFEALDAHDLDTAVGCWRPGGVDRLVGTQDLIAPEGSARTSRSCLRPSPTSRSRSWSSSSHDPLARAPASPGPPGFRASRPTGARMELEV